MPAEKLDEFLPTCSVVICTRERPIQLDQCLEAVSRSDYPKFDVLVVDNAPSDGRTQAVADRWGVRYLIEPVAGANRARNRGARACESEIVALLDDEAVPEPGWLPNLVREFTDPRVMAVVGRICALQLETEAEQRFARMGGFDAGPEWRAVDRQTPSWFELANFGGLGNGGNMAFRRRAFDVWPGFDERLGPGGAHFAGGENYAFFSLVDQGYRVVYTPHAVVHHPYPRTMDALRRRYLKSLATSAGYFTFLLFEEPCYRGAVLRYLGGALRGNRRTWRPLVRPYPRIVSRGRALLALLSGPWLYVRSRLMHQRLLNPSPSDLATGVRGHGA